MKKYFFPIFLSVYLLASCSDDNPKNKNGAIVLGDTATIVTENDAKNLGDFVADVRVKEIEKKQEEELAAQQATQVQEATTTEQKQSVPTQPPVISGKGLQVKYKEIQVFIPGIETKSFTSQNPERTGGASYQLVAGNIKGSQLRISGATITKVAQRTISYVLASNELGNLRLQSLGSTSDWKDISGRNGVYQISGINANQLEVKKATAAVIKNTVLREAKRSRCSRKTIQAWEQATGNNPSLNRPPFTVDVRSIMWKIEGKDAQGRTFYRQLRIDLPI